MIRTLGLALTLAIVGSLVHARDDTPAKPDLIVSDIYLDGDVLVFEVQNQGPGDTPKGTAVEVKITGRVKNKPVTVTEKVQIPVTPFATTTSRIPLQKLAGNDSADLEDVVGVEVDSGNTIAEERETNNTTYRALREQSQPRGDYFLAKQLPDLVVTDITYNGTNLVVHYENQGKGATGADFVIRIQCGEKSFDGNYYYRFPVPRPGAPCKTGGFNPNLIGLKSGDVAEIEVTIDHEDRVWETDKTNNAFKKKLKIE